MRIRIPAFALLAAGFAAPALLAPTDGFAAGVLQFDNPRLVLTEGQDDWVTIVRTGDATGTASVVLNASLGGTARPGDDFLVDLPVGVVQLADGELFARVKIEAPQDSVVEGTEYASLSLGNPTGATLARESSLLLQIKDDENPAALLTLPGEAVRRVTEGAALAIPVDRSGLTGQDVEITLVGAPGTAGLGIDFTDLTTVLSFGGDSTTASGELLTTQDSDVEGPETLTVLLASPKPAGEAGFSGVGPLVVIEDDDSSAGEFSLFADSSEVNESAGTASFTVDRNRGSTGTATVQWSVIDGSGTNDARAGVDYEAATGELSFADGETRKSFTVTLVDDSRVRPDRRKFEVVLANPSVPAGLDPDGRVASVSIREDDGTQAPEDDCVGVCDCFIATAAWGSWMDPHVVSLRAFRDDVLMRSPQGRSFVEFYYATSPPVAAFIARHEWLRAATRTALAPLVFAVEQPVAAALLLVSGLAGVNLAKRRGRKT